MKVSLVAQASAYDFIRNFFKLDDSPEDVAMAKKLEASLVQQDFANGEIICRIGEKANSMYFIESGRVEILGQDNEPLNEIGEGQYFGEYAVLTGEKRLSTVRSKGGTVVYCMESKAVLEGVRYHPFVYGDIIKWLYGQISQKHTKLIRLSSLMRFSSNRRGLVRDSKNLRRKSAGELLMHYGVVLLVFLMAAFFPAGGANPGPVWILLPAVFLIAYITITKRTLESIVLASLLAMVIMHRFDFLFSFYGELLATLTLGRAMEIAVILILLGSLIRLLSCSGGVNALRRLTAERIKTKRGSLATSLLCVIVVFIDDYLSLFVASTCWVPVNDKKRVSREMSAFVMGMTPQAVNTLVPLSIWGVFLTGIITLAVGEGGLGLFVRSIPFNFLSILVLLLAFLAAMGKLPLVGALKAAEERVAQGGALWPPASEHFFSNDDDGATRGKIINMLLPLLILPAASIISGTLRSGAFSINVGYGLIITLALMFALYCFQKLMTPEEFFDNVLTGAEQMFGSVMLMALMICFSQITSQLGLVELLSSTVFAFSASHYWLLPAALFVLFTAVSYLLGYSWGMYAFGLPIAIHLAQAASASDAFLALCIGAVCAAGVASDGLSHFQSDNDHFANAIGCEPKALVDARFPYFVFMTILAGAMYLVAGIVAF